MSEEKYVEATLRTQVERMLEGGASKDVVIEHLLRKHELRTYNTQQVIAKYAELAKVAGRVVVWNFQQEEEGKPHTKEEWQELFRLLGVEIFNTSQVG